MEGTTVDLLAGTIMAMDIMVAIMAGVTMGANTMGADTMGADTMAGGTMAGAIMEEAIMEDITNLQSGEARRVELYSFVSFPPAFNVAFLYSREMSLRTNFCSVPMHIKMNDGVITSMYYTIFCKI